MRKTAQLMKPTLAAHRIDCLVEHFHQFGIVFTIRTEIYSFLTSLDSSGLYRHVSTVAISKCLGASLLRLLHPRFKTDFRKAWVWERSRNRYACLEVNKCSNTTARRVGIRSNIDHQWSTFFSSTIKEKQFKGYLPRSDIWIVCATFRISPSS